MRTKAKTALKIIPTQKISLEIIPNMSNENKDIEKIISIAATD